MKYEITYSCGHEGVVDIVGPAKDRQWKLARKESGLCPECFKKQKEKELEETKKKSAAFGWPALTGTEKQIAWATDIRYRTLTELEEYRSKVVRAGGNTKYAEDSILYWSSVTDAHEWISIAHEIFAVVIDIGYSNYKKMLKKEKVTQMQKELIVECMAKPEELLHDGYVEVKIVSNKIQAFYFQKYDPFISIVKNLGYRWNGNAWSLDIYNTSDAADRAAELCSKFLLEGFAIVAPNPEVKEKAINAEYIPDSGRWIFKRVDEDLFAIRWKGHDDMLYEKARKLPESRWKKGTVLVKARYFNEIEDFAEIEDHYTDTQREFISSIHWKSI